MDACVKRRRTAVVQHVAYKHLLDDRRESLTEQHTRQFTVLCANGDLEGRFVKCDSD